VGPSVPYSTTKISITLPKLLVSIWMDVCGQGQIKYPIYSSPTAKAVAEAQDSGDLTLTEPFQGAKTLSFSA
jgi:hypothetical protein